MARRPPLTLQQRGEHARELAWSIIIGSGLAGAVLFGALASEIHHRVHRG